MESVCGRRQGRMLISWRNNERSGLKSSSHYAQILRNASHEDHLYFSKNHSIRPWQKSREGAGRDRRACAGHPPLGADRTVGSFGSVSAGKPTCKKTNVFKVQRHLQKEFPTSFDIEFGRSRPNVSACFASHPSRHIRTCTKPIYRFADFNRAVDRYAAATAKRILKPELALEIRTLLNERRVRAARSATQSFCG